MSDHPDNWTQLGNASRLIGRRVFHLTQVDSTNTVAAAHATDLANDGLVVLADEQTAGRGRLGRPWSSPPEAGILLSILLFPPEPLRRPALLTILAAVAVCETIFEITKLQATIKWPNDLYVRGKKVCGILVEQGGSTSLQPATVMGIGLNVNTPAEAFAAARLEEAGSLRMFTGCELDRRPIVRELLRNLDGGYSELLAGHLADVEARWRWHSELLGRSVCLLSFGVIHTGRLVELSFGGITLELPDGLQRHFQPESIERLRPVEEPLHPP